MPDPSNYSSWHCQDLTLRLFYSTQWINWRFWGRLTEQVHHPGGDEPGNHPVLWQGHYYNLDGFWHLPKSNLRIAQIKIPFVGWFNSNNLLIIFFQFC